MSVGPLVPTPGPDLPQLLPLAGRVAGAHEWACAERRRIVWAADVPHLPEGIATAVEERWHVRIGHGPDGSRGLPTFAEVFAHTRAEQVLRAFAQRTNLVLSGVRTTVVGAGPLASALVAMLTRVGSRVTLATDDDAAAVRFALHGHDVVPVDAVAGIAAETTFVTGEGDGVVADDLTGVLADAGTSPGSLVVAPGEGIESRAFVGRPDLRSRRWIVELPPPFGEDFTASSGTATRPGNAVEWYLADLVVAASLATVRAAAVGADAAAADALFAKAVRG
ncbi:hypothetical protein [Microbacterium sp.]|uniref:hypothetical protein n=1 Tax=Microbacterium sp. TaxID=51671 RepID=UPI003C793735